MIPTFFFFCDVETLLEIVEQTMLPRVLPIGLASWHFWASGPERPAIRWRANISGPGQSGSRLLNSVTERIRAQIAIPQTDPNNIDKKSQSRTKTQEES